MRPYKLLSLLLQYPSDDLLAAREELASAAAELPASGERDAVLRFLAGWVDAEPTVLRERYVATFDLDRRASLHLTYHTHGDRRQRGLELVRLKRRFEEAGLFLDDGELPDYLPVLLEFAALADGSAGDRLLAELRAPIELVRAWLHEQASPYAHLLDAVVGWLPQLTRREIEAIQRLAEAGPPTELVGLEPFGVEEPRPTGAEVRR